MFGCRSGGCDVWDTEQILRHLESRNGRASISFAGKHVLNNLVTRVGRQRKFENEEPEERRRVDCSLGGPSPEAP